MDGIVACMRYSCRLEELDLEVRGELLGLAHEMLLEDLQELVEDSLATLVSRSTCLPLLGVAETYELRSLRLDCSHALLRNVSYLRRQLAAGKSPEEAAALQRQLILRGLEPLLETEEY